MSRLIRISSMKYYLIFFWVLLYFKSIENASFRCDYTFNNVTNGWMKFHEVPGRWADARLRCSLEGSTLASPTSSTMRREMLKLMKAQCGLKKPVFTGLHDKFSKGAFYTLDGMSMLEFKYTWDEGQPDNLRNEEGCLTLNFNGKLSDSRCEDTFPYICFKSNSPATKVNRCGTTDDAYTYYEGTKNCYKFHVEPRNFSRADFACSAEGGHLAIINNQGEANFLKSLYEKQPPTSMVGVFVKTEFWVGFHVWRERFDFRTVHGQTLQEAGYDKFAPNVPGKRGCGSLLPNANLNDYWCGERIPFICEKRTNFPKVCFDTTSMLREGDGETKIKGSKCS